MSKKSEERRRAKAAEIEAKKKILTASDLGYQAGQIENKTGVSQADKNPFEKDSQDYFDWAGAYSYSLDDF